MVVYGGFTVDLDCICGTAYTIATACTQWVTLSFAETKVSNQMTLTSTYFHLRKCKENKYVMIDVVALGGIITAMDEMLKIL